MKNKMIKSLLSLLLTTILCFAVIIAYSSMSHAWYSDNKDTTVTGYSVKVKTFSQMSTLSCYSLHFDGIYNAICEEITDENNNITMSEYDKIFSDRNINTPLILRLTVAGVPGNDGDFIKINIPCTSEYKDSEGKVITSLSNVVKAYVGCGLYNQETQLVDTPDEYTPVPTKTTKEPDNIAIFEGVRDAIRKAHAYREDSFIDITNETKSNEITIKLEYNEYKDFIYTDVIGEGNVETNCLVFYIIFDYVDDLINDYIDSHTDANGSLDSIISFTSDIGTIYVEEGDR